MKQTGFILLFLFLLSDCAPEKKERDKNSSVFAYYLRTAFGDSIPCEKQYYILVPQNGCKGCRQSEMQILHDEVLNFQLNNKLKNLQYIISPRAGADLNLIKPAPVRIDSVGLIDKINLPLSNITIIRTENGMISLFKEVNADRMDSIGFYLQ